MWSNDLVLSHLSSGTAITPMLDPLMLSIAASVLIVLPVYLPSSFMNGFTRKEKIQMDI